MAESQSKRLEVIGARLNEPESQRWAEVMKRARQRNSLVNASIVLRDLLFGDLDIVTEADRDYLRGSPGVLPGLEGAFVDRGQVMSSGEAIAPSADKRRRAQKDMERAREHAREDQRRKKGGKK